MKKISLVIFLALFVSSCSFIQGLRKPVEIDSLDKGAKFDMKKFFSGDIEGFALIQDQNGKIIDTEILKINGKWDDNKGVIQQNFTYGSGAKDSRTWLITIDESGSFSAVGHDVVVAAQGKQVGNAMQMAYSLLVSNKSENKTEKQKTNFDDRIYLIDEKSAIMISTSTVGFSSSKKSIISLKKLGGN